MRHPHIRRRRLLVLVAGLFLFLITRIASAQQAGAGINGQVRDESGGVLPGVTVTASSPALQVKEVSDVTSTQGDYRLAPLPIGTYLVTYTLPGFQTVRQQALRLEIGMQAKLDVVLKVGTISETVTVSGAAPVVDVTSAAPSTQFTRETLELTPTARNGLISLGAQAPGVRGRVDVGGGNVGDPPEFKTFGQTYEAGITVEGMGTSDPRNSAMGGNYFDYNAIEEARVQTINNGPEVSSHGVAITMVVKSGGNDLRGGVEFSGTGSGLQSSNVNAALKAQGITNGNKLNYRRDQGGDVGGRIVRDKLWFFGALRYRPQDIAVLGAYKTDGTQADAYRGETIINQKYSYQMNGSNKFVFWHQWSQKYHYGDNITPFVAWESRSDRKPPVRTNHWKTEWQSVKGNSLVLSALFGRWNWSGGTNIDTIESTSASLAASVPEGLSITTLHDESHGGGRPSTIDQVTLLQAGQATGGGSWTDIWKYDYVATLSWFKPDLFLGNHEFKAGFDNAPYRYIQGNGDRGPAGQYQLIFNNGNPVQIAMYNYPVYPENDVLYTSVYLNDAWTVARRLTLNLGFRDERDTPSVPAQCRQAGSWSFTAAGCIPKTPFKIFNSIAPRLYFSYDLVGNGKTVVKGGWGRYDHQRLVDELNIVNPFQSVTNTFRWHDNNGNKLYDPGEVNTDPTGADFISTNAPINGVSNPDEKRPGSDQYSLSVEQVVGRNFGVRASWVYIRTFNESRFLNVLRPPSAYDIPITNPDPGPDGRVGTADDTGKTLTYWDYSAAYAGTAFEKYMITDDPNAAETHNSVDLQLARRFTNRWQFMASYSATKNNTLLARPDFARAIPFFNPNVDINTGNHTLEYLVRLSGVYMLPAGVSVSGNYNYQTGAPQSRQVLVAGGQRIPNIVINAEPIGSIHLPNASVVDLRIDKAFTLPRRQKIALRVNIYNALNTNAITAWTLRAGASYLKPTAIVPPRLAEFGLSYTF